MGRVSPLKGGGGPRTTGSRRSIGQIIVLVLLVAFLGELKLTQCKFIHEKNSSDAK